MGTPVECEHTNPVNGDSLQQTTTGLAFYRKSTNTPTFTNGSEHWALTPTGTVYWTGGSIDPPPGTGAAAPTNRPVVESLYRGDPRGVAVRLSDFEPGWVLSEEDTSHVDEGLYSATFSTGGGVVFRTIIVSVWDTIANAKASWKGVWTVLSPGWKPMSVSMFGDATWATTYPPNGRVTIYARIKNVIVSSGGLDMDVAAQMTQIMVNKVLSQTG